MNLDQSQYSIRSFTIHQNQIKITQNDIGIQKFNDYEDSLQLPCFEFNYSNEYKKQCQKQQIQFGEVLEVADESIKLKKCFKTKNILTNIATWINQFMKKRLDSKNRELFYKLFMKESRYKGLNKYSIIFNSILQPYCIQFFTKDALELLIKSNIKNKQVYLEVFGQLRQGAINGKITNLTNNTKTRL